MLRRTFPALLVIVIFYSSCRKDATAPKYDFAVPVTVPPCDTNALTWNHGMAGIISAYCSYSPATGNRGCHFPGEGNYDFKQYAVVADRIRSGRFTERMLLPAEHPLSMPPPGFVRDSCHFAQIMTWIESGFPEN